MLTVYLANRSVLSYFKDAERTRFIRRHLGDSGFHRDC